MDRNFWIHVGVEVFAFMGITLYFHRQNVSMLSEITKMKAQMAEMSQRISTSANPFLKRDDLFRQVSEMEQTMKTMADYINTLKRQIQVQSQELTDAQGDINQVKQRIVETVKTVEDLEGSAKGKRLQVVEVDEPSSPLISLQTPRKLDNDGLPILSDKDLDEQIKALDSDSGSTK